jgi:hypothetical protein
MTRRSLHGSRRTNFATHRRGCSTLGATAFATRIAGMK